LPPHDRHVVAQVRETKRAGGQLAEARDAIALHFSENIGRRFVHFIHPHVPWLIFTTIIPAFSRITLGY
jgi:hypothetical protein